MAFIRVKAKSQIDYDRRRYDEGDEFDLNKDLLPMYHLDVEILTAKSFREDMVTKEVKPRAVKKK